MDRHIDLLPNQRKARTEGAGSPVGAERDSGSRWWVRLKSYFPTLWVHIAATLLVAVASYLVNQTERIPSPWKLRITVSIVVVAIVGLLLWRYRKMKTRVKVLEAEKQHRLERAVQPEEAARRGGRGEAGLTHGSDGGPERLLKRSGRENERDGASALGVPGRLYERFEDIKREGIEYSHLIYLPLLNHDDKNKACGPALDLLKRCFDDTHLRERIGKTRWVTILEELDPDSEKIETGVHEPGPQSSNCKILATPIFETRSRAARISFSRPLFFSEVGAYVSRRNPHFRELIKRAKSKHRRRLACWREVLEETRGISGSLRFTVIEGEISQQIVDNDVRPPESQVSRKSQEVFGVTDLIETLAHSKNHVDYVDIVFAERLQADRCTEEEKSGSVINILSPGELFYPVCYALPRAENVLRTYLNFRLAALDAEMEGGVVRFLANGLLGWTEEERKVRAREYLLPFRPTLSGDLPTVGSA